MSLDYQRFDVLYVDDEPGNLAAFSFAFESRFSIHTANSGEEALRILVERDVAVLLADERMPGMRGHELCARARVLRPETVRMIMTAYADLDAAMQAINQGQVRRYLSKPWKEEEVDEALRTAIEVYHFQDMVHEMERKLLRDERAAGRLLGAALLDHQLRSQITPLMANMESLQRAASRMTDPAISKDVGELAADCLHSLEMMKGLLAAAQQGDVLRSEEGADSDVVRVVELSIQHMRGQINQRARIGVISTEGHPHAGIAPRELIQVLTNLFANSWQALPEGQSFRNRIDVQVSMDGDHVIIEVADTGAGIAPENLPKIFELFFTTRRDAGGTGLGLHIVKTIVTFRKGEVSVTSEPGKGTTFRIRLPPPEKR